MTQDGKVVVWKMVEGCQPKLKRSFDLKVKVGLVLVTPAMLERLPKESVADKELSALLAGNQIVPIVHNTTYEALRNVSPLLASRSGLDTSEDSMSVIAEKIAELVDV